MFLRIRQTWFPVESIDQIDDVGGRLRVHLSSGVKIDLDPIESEKVSARVASMCAGGDQAPRAAAGESSRITSLEASVRALEARIASMRDQLEREKAGRVRSHA
jgi:uncharacterized small protein (DUF1192 family)